MGSWWVEIDSSSVIRFPFQVTKPTHPSDALASDPVAQLSLQPENFAEFSALLKSRFGKRLVFGLEGGYELEGMPKAVVRTMEPFVVSETEKVAPREAAAAAQAVSTV